MKAFTIFAILGLCLIVLCAGAPQKDPSNTIASTTRRSVSNGKTPSITTKKPTGKKGGRGTRGSNKKPAKVTSTTTSPAPVPLVSTAAAKPFLAIGTTVPSVTPRPSPIVSANGTNSADKPAVFQQQKQNTTSLAQNGSLVRPAFTTGNASRPQNQNQTRVRREIMETMVLNSTDTDHNPTEYGFCGRMGEIFSGLGIKVEQNGSGFSNALATFCQSVDRLIMVVSNSAMKSRMPGRYARPMQVNMTTHWNSTAMSG